jgi:hypothetical protein
VVDGELPEAFAIARDAKVGIAELQALEAELTTAAEACVGA